MNSHKIKLSQIATRRFKHIQTDNKTKHKSSDLLLIAVDLSDEAISRMIAL